RFKATALRKISIVDPVVISPRQLDGPIAADDLAEGKPGAGVQDGSADSDLLEKQFPSLATDVGECSFRSEMAVGAVQVIDGRKRAFSTPIGETFADIILRHVSPERRQVPHPLS